MVQLSVYIESYGRIHTHTSSTPIYNQIDCYETSKYIEIVTHETVFKWEQQSKHHVGMDFIFFGHWSGWNWNKFWILLLIYYFLKKCVFFVLFFDFFILRVCLFSCLFQYHTHILHWAFDSVWSEDQFRSWNIFIKTEWIYIYI